MREWVRISLGNSVDGQLIVATDLNVVILFDHRDYWGRPVGDLHWRDHSLVL